MRWPNENLYDAIVARASARYGVPATLIKAVIAQESGFTARAYRAEAPRDSLPPTPDFPKGGDESRGLMQLLVRTARSLGYTGTADGLYDPSVNIDLGTKLLSQLLRYAVTPDAALSAYNGGFSAVRRGDGKRVTNQPGAPFINQKYVDDVNAKHAYFLSLVTPAQPPPPPPPTTPSDPKADAQDAKGSATLWIIVAILVALLLIGGAYAATAR